MTTHTFEPKQYHNTLGPHNPVLRVRDGDTVITSTVDSRGADKNLNTVAQRPNPMTGPFYIEEAEPGDTLVVQFDHILPNRSTGVDANILAPQVVEPEVFKAFPERDFVEWVFDFERGMARPSEPIAYLENIELPLAPFLGCFGVAPARGEMITTASSGEHGGNMDCRFFQKGSTAYFPVFEPGALFFLGDGHARQGDGEVTGTGIETSLEVKFTVRLLKGKTIGWPRGEDEQYIFTVGNAKPLEQALQHATSEMVRWLRDDYGLDDRAASILLGQCVEYNVGNVYNPAYTMVCKLNKAVLPRKVTEE